MASRLEVLAGVARNLDLRWVLVGFGCFIVTEYALWITMPDRDPFLAAVNGRVPTQRAAARWVAETREEDARRDGGGYRG